MFRRMVGLVCLVLGFCVTPAAWADTEIYTVPSAWRLQDYLGTNLVVWFSGSTCGNGRLEFPSTATVDNRNRFFSMVMTAKVSGKAVGVFYDASSGSCLITSFYMQQ